MMERRDWLRLGANTALVAVLAACGGRGGSPAQAQTVQPLRKRITTRDGVDLSVIDAGDATKPALLFIHGLSQSALSWLAQLSASELLSKYRLVAVDLRGHGLSQGAFGALAEDGTPLPQLAGSKYVANSDAAATTQLWANDIDAVIDGLALVSTVLVGWSYGAVVVLDYMKAHNGLGAASKVVMTSGTPVLLAPGSAGGGGGDVVFGPGVPLAVFKTLDSNLLTNPPVPSTVAEVVGGMSEFVQLALQDSVPGRPAATRDEIIAATVFNLQLPPSARQAIVLRQFDHRDFLTALPAATKQRMLVISGTADAVIQSANTQTYYTAAGISVVPLANEGHSPFSRNPSLFNTRLINFIAS